MKILIIRGSSIGDIVEALPVASALKELYGSSCTIYWLVKKKFSNIVDNNKNIDYTLTYEAYKDTAFRFIRLLAKRRYVDVPSGKAAKMLQYTKASGLKKFGFDIVLDLHGTFDSKLYAVATGCSKVILADFLRSSDPVYGSLKHRVLENMDIIGKLDAGFDISSFLETVDCGWRVNEYLPLAGKKFIVLVLATTWPSKNYPPACWVEVINKLSATGERLVFLGGKGDRGIVDFINSRIKNANCMDLVGKTSLQEMLGILANACLVVGGDTGPLHIAASMKIPTITLMGPTYADKYKPFGKLSRVLVSDYPCTCCHIEKCPKNICCMEHIPPEKVVKLIKACL